MGPQANSLLNCNKQNCDQHEQNFQNEEKGPRGILIGEEDLDFGSTSEGPVKTHLMKNPRMFMMSKGYEDERRFK